jgi:Tol biopolymer transport system component
VSNTMRRALRFRGAALLVVLTLAAYRVRAQDEPASRPAWPHPSCNSASDDYAPAADADGRALLFTSERDGIAHTYRCEANGSAELVAGTLNRSGAVGAYAHVLPSGEGIATVYRSGTRQSFASIVTTVRTSSGLDVGSPLDVANGEFFAAQASIAPDRSRILFVSDREGGSGGLDIWMLEKRPDGTWSEPQHGGEAINSPGDELAPVLIASDTLLFASDAMGGQGGHDIYLSVLRGGRWSDPVPMTMLNSSWNDTDATRLVDGTYYVSSDRPGGRGGYDIWVWRPE